jgi:hypothetical protein
MNTRRTLFILFVFLATSFTTSNAGILKWAASEGSFINAAAGEETTIWQKFKAGSYVLVQINTAVEIVETTKQLLQQTKEFISQNLNIIKKIIEKTQAKNKKAQSSSSKRTPQELNSYNLQSTLKKINELFNEAKTTIDTKNKQSYLDPAFRTMLLEKISDMNTTFNSFVNNLPKMILTIFFQGDSAVSSNSSEPNTPTSSRSPGLSRKNSSSKMNSPVQREDSLSDWDIIEPESGSTRTPNPQDSSYSRKRKASTSNIPAPKRNKISASEIDQDSI